MREQVKQLAWVPAASICGIMVLSFFAYSHELRSAKCVRKGSKQTCCGP